MIAFETDVRIERPLEEVFAYLAEPLAHSNSAVLALRRISASENGAGSTYLMERQLPTGRALNRLEVVASEPPRQFPIRATDGPTPFLYRYGFFSENGATVVRLTADVELPRAATILPQLARRGVKSGVDDNLATLKRILERDRP